MNLDAGAEQAAMLLLSERFGWGERPWLLSTSRQECVSELVRRRTVSNRDQRLGLGLPSFTSSWHPKFSLCALVTSVVLRWEKPSSGTSPRSATSISPSIALAPLRITSAKSRTSGECHPHSGLSPTNGTPGLRVQQYYGHL
jgi:hypothetical protein